MKQKTAHKHIFLWSVLSIIGAAAVAVIVVPPMITLNELKPELQKIIVNQTGIPADIRGDVNFSLLGQTTIVAHDVIVPFGNIKSITFTIPSFDIFDIPNARIGDEIAVRGGDFKITKLEPFNISRDVLIYDTSVRFLNKDYDIVRGTLSNGGLTGTVRTNQHRYEIDVSGDEFHIHNQNDNLEIYGILFSNGTARGRMAIDTNDINSWFEFSQPRIDIPVQMTTNFDWDGEYGFVFSDIHANNVTGDIKVMSDGGRAIKLKSKNINFDFSFLLDSPDIMNNADVDIDFYGDIKLGRYSFGHFAIVAHGNDSVIHLTHLTADDIKLTGGIISTNGAQDVLVKMPLDGQELSCIFSGNKTTWQCSRFTYGDAYGTISVSGDTFYVKIKSPQNMPESESLRNYIAKLGTRGRLEFSFADAAGILDITPKGVTPHYTFANDRTFGWLESGFTFMPQFMLDDVGDYVWRNNIMEFTPHSGRWFFSMTNNRFYLSGTNIKDLFPNIDLQSLRDMDYVISGTYNKDNISDLVINIAGHTFTGSISGNTLTLQTTLLNMDSFINQNFIDNYEELSFLTNSPIMLPFALKTRVSLTANKLIYNGDEYTNFVYSLQPNTQTFSITDNSRGALLATITKDKSTYAIFLKLAKFITHGTILSTRMPLNIHDTIITGEINMTTTGNIAHDLEYNLLGELDLMFDGGYLTGLGIDNFYASAENITRMNADYAISDALEGGETRIKKMHLTGMYDTGNFKTTTPFTLSVRHTDVIGNINVSDGRMSAEMEITMRGTSPDATMIVLDIMPDGTRNYSLSEIMKSFDSAFMRAFVRTHDKF